MDFLEVIASNFERIEDLRNFSCLFNVFLPNSFWKIENNDLFFLDELVIEVEFHSNEKKKSEKTYHNRIMEGPFKRWHRNGQKSIDTTLHNGKYHGLVTFLTSKGQIHYQGMYLFGEKEGFWSFWWGNGYRHSEGSYINGKEYGKWHYWDEFGTNGHDIEYV